MRLESFPRKIVRRGCFSNASKDIRPIPENVRGEEATSLKILASALHMEFQFHILQDSRRTQTPQGREESDSPALKSGQRRRERSLHTREDVKRLVRDLRFAERMRQRKYERRRALGSFFSDSYRYGRSLLHPPKSGELSIEPDKLEEHLLKKVFVRYCLGIID